MREIGKAISIEGRAKYNAYFAQDDRISKAVTVAKHSDLTIAVLGLDENLEGEEMDQGNSVGSGDKVHCSFLYR